MRMNQLGQRAGPVREKERADWATGRECWAGWVEGEEKMGRGERMGWVVLGLGPLSISISFSFANSHKLV